MTEASSPKNHLAQIARLAENPVLRLARELRSDPFFDLKKRMDEALRGMRVFEQQRSAIAGFLEQAESIRNSLRIAAVSENLIHFNQQRMEIIRALDFACLPTESAITALSVRLTNAIEPFASISAWKDDFARQMAGLDVPWALSDHMGESMLGFARISRLSDATHSIEPYVEPVNELVAEELGAGVEAETDETPLERDAASIDAGLNPVLIAFPPQAYSRVVFAAGFTLSLEGAPVPQALEAGDPEAVFDPNHNFALTEVEQRLRQLIEKSLQALSGQKWVKRRVSEAVRSRWIDRRADERAKGRPVYALIQYADFMDLADVICQNNNWNDAFEPIFRNRDDFGVSLRRLHPIRNAMSHSRPLGRADVLTLVCEATRILGSLGVQVFP